MKFRSAIITSIVLHFVLILIAYFYPQGINTNGTTYYVDLIQIAGTPGSSSVKSIEDTKTDLLNSIEKSVKNLSVKSEKKPDLTYPDKLSKKRSKKKKKKELISVVRRKKNIKNVDKTREIPNREQGGYVSTGLSGSGSAYGTGGPGGNFPYSYYVETLKGKITSSWYNPLTSSGISGKFLAVVYFRIFKDGKISELKLIKKSGNNYFDLSTLRVIKEVKPFPPLPSDYPESYLGVYFEFVWER